MPVVSDHNSICARVPPRRVGGRLPHAEPRAGDVHEPVHAAPETQDSVHVRLAAALGLQEDDARGARAVFTPSDPDEIRWYIL
jgi:hypothetical protein